MPEAAEAGWRTRYAGDGGANPSDYACEGQTRTFGENGDSVSYHRVKMQYEEGWAW